MPDGPSYCRPARNSGPSRTTNIDATVQFLSRADSYPEHPTTQIEIVETHYSWVFLTDTRAYKLKKPVQGVGFDLRLPEARRRNALAEVRLNRRLAADVYLGVVPLGLGPNGRLAVGGPGTPVDWLVKMVRLPAGRTLDRRLARHQLRYAEIEVLARRLADFFAAARRVRLSAAQFNACISRELCACVAAFRVAGEPALLDAATVSARRLGSFLLRRAALFRERIRDGRIVDGHGDLRPEHIYLDGNPRIIDCLEFRAELRQLDPANEIAFLALECRRIGGPAIEPHLLRRYRQRSGDEPKPELVRFYAALNALIRARIAVRHLCEPRRGAREKWVARAAEYLALAAQQSRFLVG